MNVTNNWSEKIALTIKTERVKGDNLVETHDPSAKVLVRVSPSRIADPETKALPRNEIRTGFRFSSFSKV